MRELNSPTDQPAELPEHFLGFPILVGTEQDERRDDARMIVVTLLVRHILTHTQRIEDARKVA